MLKALGGGVPGGGAGEPADTMKMSPLDVGPLGRPLNVDTSTSTGEPDASNLLIVAKLRRSSGRFLCFGGRSRPRCRETVPRGNAVTASVCGVVSTFRRQDDRLWV